MSDTLSVHVPPLHDEPPRPALATNTLSRSERRRDAALSTCARDADALPMWRAAKLRQHLNTAHPLYLASPYPEAAGRPMRPRTAAVQSPAGTAVGPNRATGHFVWSRPSTAGAGRLSPSRSSSSSSASLKNLTALLRAHEHDGGGTAVVLGDRSMAKLGIAPPSSAPSKTRAAARSPAIAQSPQQARVLIDHLPVRRDTAAVRRQLLGGK